MTNAQMLRNLLAVYERLVVVNGPRRVSNDAPELKEVIAELRRRIELEGLK